MSWLKNKKIIISLGISVVVFGGLFCYLFGILTAKAQEQIKIFPTSFSGDWQNPTAAFSQDLREGAVFGEFNIENSTYPVGISTIETTTPSQEGVEMVEKVLELSNFSISEGFNDKKIQNVQLRLSLAGKGNPEDKLTIEYFYQDSWQNLASFDLENEISNALNGGYFLYGLPIFESWEDLNALKIRFQVSGSKFQEVYLDALWLELEIEEIEQPPEEQPSTPFIKKGDFLKPGKHDWKRNEEPEFEFKKTTPKMTAILIDPNGKESLEGVIIQDNKVKIFQLDKRSFRPGLYRLKIKVKEGGEEFVQEEYFSWGVLAINFNKSIYLPEEKAYLQMGVLDNLGHTICDADLVLEITNPAGGKTILSTTDGNIIRNPECGPNNVIDTPDYFGYYQVAGTGIYQIKLTANTYNGIREITDQFEVRDWVPFDVERIGPTRIYPPVSYGMTLKIKVNQDFAGEVIEQIPASFELTGRETDAKLVRETDAKQIIWQVDWKAGETYELSYQFDAPDISPYLYLLGPLEFYD